MSSPCPTSERLAAAVRGSAVSIADADLATHVGECSDCQAQLEAMAGGVDWLTAQLRSHGRATSAASAAKDKPGARGPERSPLLDRAMEDLECRAERQVGPKADPLLSPGTRLKYFGDYEILEELGRGGMGVVYRARQVSLNRSVALKLILAGQLASESEVRRFRTEAEAAAMLDHPTIVPIHEIGENEDRHYFSMKLVEGGALSERIANAGARSTNVSSGGRGLPFDFHDSARVISQVARAVHYAHQRGVLHRDLKPSNILLDGRDQPHLTDFGLAKLLERDSGLTRSVAILGTPNYIAPETASGKAKEVTVAADVYSLGAVLYELLTGRPPFQEDNVAATLQKVLHAEPTPPRSVQPEVPRDLEVICLKSLEKEPGRRFATAQDLAEELERFLRHEPILSRRISVAGRLGRWARRNPALAGAMGTAAVVLVLGLAGVTWKWRGEMFHRQRAQEESLQARRAVTRLEIERAESLLRSGNTAKGLAQLARLLRHDPTNRVAAERLLNALSHRPFCLPVAPLKHGKSLGTWKTNQEPSWAETFPFRNAGSLVRASPSPDGRWLVTASMDGTARLWDGVTGQPLAAPLRHQAEVLWAQFSPDSLKVVTASMDHSARVWDAQTGQPLTAPLKHQNLVWCAVFSPDGRRVVTASEDASARIWDAQTGQPVGEPFVHSNPVFYASFSPDNDRLLTAVRTGGERKAYLWDIQAGRVIARMQHHFFRHSPRPFPEFGPGAGQIVTFRWTDGYLWKDGGGEPMLIRRLPHEFYAHGATFSRDGLQVATASTDNTARIWDATTGEAVLPPLRHQASVPSAQFTADNQRLLTASTDRSARIWDTKTGQLLTEPIRHEIAVLSAIHGGNDRRVLTIPETDTAWLWDVRIAPVPALSLPQRLGAEYACFSPDGRRIAIVTGTSVCVWNAETGQPLSRRMTHGSTLIIHDVAFSPDSRYLATGAEHKSAQVWDAATGMAVTPPLEHDSDVRRVRFSPDGKRILTASADGTARVWEASTGRPLLVARHAAYVGDAEFSPDGRLFVTASWDNTARIWDSQTGQPITAPLRHEANVFHAEFDPTGERVATVSKDKTARIWSVRTGKMLTPPLIHDETLRERTGAAHFNADGTRLATVASDAVQVWDVITGRLISAPLRHGTQIRSVRFSPDGTRLVCAADDGTAWLMDPATGHRLGEPLGHDARVTYAEFSSDGTRVVTSSMDKSVRIWPVLSAPTPVPDWLPGLAEAVASQRLDDQDFSQAVSVETLYRVRQELTVTGQPPGHYGDWARWFFADTAERSPWFSPATTSDP